MNNALRVSAILLLFVGVGFWYSLAVPPFEAPDELFHYAFARHLAQGNPLPVQKPGEETPWEQEGSQAPLYYWVVGRLTAGIDQSDFEQLRVRNPRANIGDPLFPGNKNFMLYSAAHHPLVGSNLALHVGRWFSLLLGALTLLFTYGTARLAFPAAPKLALISLLWVATLPQFAFISAALTNDTLITAASAAVVYWLARLLSKAQHDQTAAIGLADWLVLGLLLGLAALSKLQGLGLFLLSALVGLWIAWQRRDWRLPLRAFLPVALPALALAGWWYWRNHILYGDWLGVGSLLAINGQRGDALSLSGFWQEFRGLRYSFWGLFGWFNLLLPGWVYTVLDMATVIALGGLLVQPWRQTSSVKRETSSVKRQTSSVKRQTSSVKRQTSNVKRETSNVKRQTSSVRQPAASSHQPAASSQQPAASSHQPAASSQQPAASSQQPAASSQQPAASSHQPAAIVYLLTLWALLSLALILYWASRATGSQGRLLFPALNAFAILWVIGWDSWVRYLPQHWQLVAWLGIPVLLLGCSLYTLSVLLPASYQAPTPVAAPPASATKVDVIYGDQEHIHLLALEVPPQRFRVGERVPVTLYLQAPQPVHEDYQLFIQFLDEKGVEVGNLTSHPAWGRNPTSLWQPGALYADAYPVLISGALDPRSPLLARVYVGFVDPKTERSGRFPIPARTSRGAEITPFVGQIAISPRQPPDLSATPLITAGVGFGQVIQLTGHHYSPTVTLAAATPLTVTLVWDALGTPATDYTAFLHLRTRDGVKVAGFDQAPAAVRFPTRFWRAGDRVVSAFGLALPADLPAGEYALWVGLYETASQGALRLPVTDPAGQVTGDGEVLLGMVVVGK